MYKLCFYVPPENTDAVKQAAFDAGAGRIGHYECCAWQTAGEGQFRPLAGSDPHIGQHNQLEKVIENRVEMICAEHCIKAALSAIRQAHPYEEPAIDIWRLETMP